MVMGANGMKKLSMEIFKNKIMNLQFFKYIFSPFTFFSQHSFLLIGRKIPNLDIVLFWYLVVEMDGVDECPETSGIRIEEIDDEDQDENKEVAQQYEFVSPEEMNVCKNNFSPLIWSNFTSLVAFNRERKKKLKI